MKLEFIYLNLGHRPCIPCIDDDKLCVNLVTIFALE